METPDMISICTQEFTNMGHSQSFHAISTCSNCGKIGHLFYQCKLPITSYGIILFRINDGKIEYLMIRRKDSFGYIDFIRGKYTINNVFQIQKCIDEMSTVEKSRLLNNNFDFLWKELWGNISTPLYKSEELSSCKKFETLKNGIMVNGSVVTLETLVKNSKTNWSEQEWEFPKGRRNYRENDMECAIREFEEETGFKKQDIQIIENVVPYEEYFIGSNFKAYKHKFYIAYTESCNSTLGFQQSEVSKMEWMTIELCLKYIRPYNLEKKRIINSINKMLKENSFYS